MKIHQEITLTLKYFLSIFFFAYAIGTVGCETTTLEPANQTWTTVFSFSVEQETFVRVVLENSYGVEVEILLNKLCQRGEYGVSTRFYGRPEGLYSVVIYFNGIEAKRYAVLVMRN
jgi:hypothetical protein